MFISWAFRDYWHFFGELPSRLLRISRYCGAPRRLTEAFKVWTIPEAPDVPIFID